jgi:hypothetical protein
MGKKNQTREKGEENILNITKNESRTQFAASSVSISTSLREICRSILKWLKSLAVGPLVATPSCRKFWHQQPPPPPAKILNVSALLERILALTALL